MFRQIPKTKNKIQKPITTDVLYFHRTEIKIIPKIKTASKTGREKLKNELKNMPKTKERQKYRKILDAVIILFYLTWQISKKGAMAF